MLHIIDLVPWVVAASFAILLVLDASDTFLIPTRTCRTISMVLTGILVLYICIKLFGDL